MLPATAYQILAVPIGATRKQIDNNYRKLAIKYHPDLYPDDMFALKKFKQITEAYAILTDRVSRKDYDESLNKRKTKYSRVDYVRMCKNLRKKRRRHK